MTAVDHAELKRLEGELSRFARMERARAVGARKRPISVQDAPYHDACADTFERAVVVLSTHAALLSEIEGLKAANKDHCRAVNTLTLEAVEFERQIADLRASAAKTNSGFEEYERKFYLASDDVDRLKLAICGGEDAPGAINAVSVEDCERFIAEERGRHIDTEARISAAGVGFDGGSLTLGALERARSEYDIGFQDGCAEEFRKAQPEYDFKAEDEWFEHVLSRPDDYEGPDAGMHDTEIVENEDV